MQRLLDGRAQLGEMGDNSRRLAEERFDVHAVNRVILDALEL
jgi:hypothetical protein